MKTLPLITIALLASTTSNAGLEKATISNMAYHIVCSDTMYDRSMWDEGTWHEDTGLGYMKRGQEKYGAGWSKQIQPTINDQRDKYRTSQDYFEMCLGDYERASK
ncbi:hypothetical protein C9J01_10280 [Photobacterium rosenbergii]|uniref:Uncharacterized protein n=1 Tax=Photobacterium rosenbergii TaxID=294936 RepID=A0A2T3NF82_9GAMM|nr:hypothetical protein [Photobacterium rosenbergii]PSW13233.1 hypothetical protein C9J01_10280 [Photobacterium rosenbergii]